MERIIFLTVCKHLKNSIESMNDKNCFATKISVARQRERGTGQRKHSLFRMKGIFFSEVYCVLFFLGKASTF